MPSRPAPTLPPLASAPARRVYPLLLAVLALLGCDLFADRAPVSFEVPRERFYDFLQTPWPSDVLRDGDGLDLSAFPNPYESSTLDDYVALMRTAPGYASSGAMYFHVDGGVDGSTLPQTPRDSVGPDATMFLVTLADPTRRVPIEWVDYPDGTAFLPPGTVAVLPLLGALVDGPAALVVTTKARASDGRALGASADLRALMRCEPIDGALVQPDCEAYQTLPLQVGLSYDDVALLQVFTPQRPTDSLRRGFEMLTAREAPRVKNLALTDAETYSAYTVFRGTVELAQLQAGSPPFNIFDHVIGGFVLGDDGAPIVQRHEDVELVLTVPKTTQPEGGWPIVIYSHGTGGSLDSGLGEGPSVEAHQLARAGCAMLAVSEPLHKTREGHVEGSDEINTFNFLNPLAGRDNWAQSALEKVQLVSAAQELIVPAAVAGRAAVLFDAEQVHYFGHSQGGIVGTLLAGVEDRVGGLFLSGAGGGFARSLIEKTEPVELAEVVRLLLSLPEDEPLDRFHPVPNLMQIWVEPIEPLNYGAAWRHRTGRNTPHLVITSGLLDPYTPPRNHDALAAAFGVPLIKPASQSSEILDLMGLQPVDGPATGNLRTDDGAPLTGGLLQYPEDGHFAVFYNPDAQEAYRAFFDGLRMGLPVARVR